jgi:(R,R)-butanediol dehydrogenase / meso-butanediol dehydrogenase / diacetyl reductase
MKAARFYDKYDIRIEDIEPPKRNNSDEVLIDVAWGGICGTGM